ncbi:AtuA-related protein [Mameliella sediminis]|uniref:AtuA-related protein n=1 Tax=Mameliella sediminis TaxID=2836866 RepID=UPI001C46982C|nr:hypothetical protein [Mameliella sediminis]MBV7396881.1 hypothetical protein [Mameliella sediminis]MBY6116161.1 hypothetical protein [Antarctobacter heliothermus]MBY6146126.1 hypothetical protein [Mameliella alba]MCA0955311.1 hypothetical protein [Mameliella alba]
MTENDPIVKVPLHEVAHGRAGDKGNRLNISVIPYNEAAYTYIAKQMTAERVHEVFRYRGTTKVQRYDLPKLASFNFVIDNVLEGGVNSSLNLDGHGKTLSFRLLAEEVEVPESTLHPASPYKRSA